MSEKKLPKVSVIVPVYNVEEYLPTCLDSLINQTLREIEIICVNDGSTDKSLSILQSYAKKDNRIIIINKENSGPGDSRNVALNCVNGEFVLFVDGDDWIDKKTCSVCYEKAKENNVDFISFNANIVYGDDVKPYYYYGMKEDKTVIFNDVERKIFYEKFHSWHYFFKSSFLNENKIRYPQLFLCEDVPFILNCWLVAKKVYCLADCFYNYVQRQSSITHINTHMMDIFPVLKQIEVLLNKYKRTNERLLSDFSNWKLRHLMWIFKVLKKTKFASICQSCCKKICTKVEYEKLIAECGYFVRLFKMPLFELKCKKNKRIYKILNCSFFSIYKKSRKSIRKDKEDFKKWYKVFGFPIIKIKKKYYFNGYKKLIYFCGLCVYKNSYDKLQKKIVSFNKKYKKTLKRLKTKIKNGEKIRVAFYVNDSKFKTQTVFNLLKKNKYYHPFVLVGKNDVSEKNAEYQTLEDMQKIYNYFKNRGMDVYFAFDFKTNKPISLLNFQPDIIFYSRQYALAKEHKIDAVVNVALPVYVPYFVPNSPIEVEAGSDFHNLLWLYFVLNIDTKNNYASVMKNKGKNLVVTGHPTLDAYLDETKKKSKYIIYAPHWSIGNTLLNYATFEWSGEKILEFAKKHPELNWVFKPHPMLYNRLIVTGYMSKKEVDEYYAEWEKIGVYYSGPDYFDYFKSSKALITDCGSFIAEYLPTKNPVILMRSSRSTPYNFLGAVISKCYYNVHNIEELEHMLKQILLEKQDIRKQERLEMLQQLNLVKNASENIVNILNRELM